MENQAVIVWKSSEGKRCELTISHTVCPAVQVAKEWARRFTRDTGIEHTVESNGKRVA